MFIPLTQTDLFILEATGGQSVAFGDNIRISSPSNPEYYWGNSLLLSEPPAADTLESAIEKTRCAFEDLPLVKHLMFRWDGAPLTEKARQKANALGLALEEGVSMSATKLTAPIVPGLIIRELNVAEDWDAFVVLNIACDPSEQTGNLDYRSFKEHWRQKARTLMQGDITQWWGAFANGELVAQCGMVKCSGRLGRFQAVETHPEHRRQGICSQLIAYVGTNALQNGCQKVLLGADSEGPALKLYQRLGFKKGKQQFGLRLGGESVHIRPELSGDRAEVRSINIAAFPSDQEARLVDSLRDLPDVISLVAVRASNVLGHALFSPVTHIRPQDPLMKGIALGPIAVRPSQQGCGIGRKLIEAGLAQCREAGWLVAFVLGDPNYYGRFGWTAAAAHQLHCKWNLPPELFQCLELTPGGLDGWSGLVEYHPAFDELT